jgi:carboxyl-terminal processing protease
VAINLAGWFVEKGTVVVKERFKDPSSDRIFRANGSGAFKDLPVVILMNQGSASASEILAGALRDINGTRLIGEKSFGKGTVQELHTLRDNSKLKITVAKWVLPNENIIDKEGLKPDIEVKLTEEDIEAERDPQLDKAIEVLLNQIGGYTN